MRRGSTDSLPDPHYFFCLLNDYRLSLTSLMKTMAPRMLPNQNQGSIPFGVEPLASDFVIVPLLAHNVSIMRTVLPSRLYKASSLVSQLWNYTHEEKPSLFSSMQLSGSASSEDARWNIPLLAPLVEKRFQWS
jgi:hypothetical protein